MPPSTRSGRNEPRRRETDHGRSHGRKDSKPASDRKTLRSGRRDFRTGEERARSKRISGQADALEAKQKKTVEEMQAENAGRLMKSVKNLGPGADVWTHVNSILTSEQPGTHFESICNGYRNKTLKGIPVRRAEAAGRVERLRWYERM